MEYTERREELRNKSNGRHGNLSPNNGAQKKTRNKCGLGNVFVRIYVVKTLSLAKTKMTEVESKIADACDKMKGFEKKES
ncbi:hypothetical protein LEP1GSC036_0639 [Leptospira weilii str. 2006001853]|uniref:Uncharacterized protein n=1 Tax=Leptospira weilii str. 2006001853 TaxID=1001589 RepID=A0A828Z0Y1_9LEPT|nr:hypothetical protein [Leptospira weilii]EKR64054.1 hypothetical protein LEP1GSC036_0639 [Leptospira weilii str. 2006001853]